MGDCYRQQQQQRERQVRGAGSSSCSITAAGDELDAFVRRDQQIGAKKLQQAACDGSIRPMRLRGGANDELRLEVASNLLSNSRQSLEELSESQQVLTSLQVNSKSVPANFNKRQLIGQASNQQRDGNQVVALGAASAELGNEVKLSKRPKRHRVLDPAGSLYYHWSAVVSFAFLYNFWSLSYRFAFCEIDFDSMALWFALDYSADIIYTLDVIVNHHTGYLEDGVLERNLDKIGQHYRDCTLFYLDCLCLLPLDVLYLSIGFNSILRCTRLVKIYKFWSYVDRTERHTNYPNVFRTFTLVHYILVIFHWNACLFHMISKNKLIDIESLYKINDNRCYDILCQYLHAFYWSTLALTTIGDLPRPRTKGEYVYVTVELFFGLFLFASVLGHVANIVTNVSAARKEFQAKLDAVKTFMRMRRVSDELQNKVIRWFDYLWISQKSSDDERSVACLPDRLKAEIAIHVHLDTLKRVDIFQNTEAGFLCELVLRLKPVLFSPGDYVCRKNEVGHEMYIVSRGILEVVTNEGATVVATLKAGSYFGEISVLNVGLAGNKRTASVRSVGYSDLFCLNKQDLWDVLKNYPNAEARIRSRAEERLSKLDINNSSNPNANNNNSNNNKHGSGGYLRVPNARRNFLEPDGQIKGSQSTSSNINASAGYPPRQRQRLCSSGSRHKLAARNHNQLEGLVDGQLIWGRSACGQPRPRCNEQVLGSCNGRHRHKLCSRNRNCHSNRPNLGHLLEPTGLPGGRDGGGSATGRRPVHQHQHQQQLQPGSLFAASSFSSAPPNYADQLASSAGSQSRSLDQTVPCHANADRKDNALARKRRYQNSNQSRDEEDEEEQEEEVAEAEPDAEEAGDRPAGGCASPAGSSNDESPSDGIAQIANLDGSHPFGACRGRSQATATIKRTNSADQIRAFGNRSSAARERSVDDEDCCTGAGIVENRRNAARAEQAASIEHLSSESMDSSCCFQAPDQQTLASPSCWHHSSRQSSADAYLTASLLLPQLGLAPAQAGSRQSRRRRPAGGGNQRHCCPRNACSSAHHQGSNTPRRRFYHHQQPTVPASGLWLANEYQTGQQVPTYLQVPLLAAQTSAGGYQLLQAGNRRLVQQPMLAASGQHQSLSMTQLNRHHQQVFRRPDQSNSPQPADFGPFATEKVPLEAGQAAHLASKSVQSFGSIDGQRQIETRNQAPANEPRSSPPTTFTSNTCDSVQSASTSQRPHPSLQAAQSGLDGSGALADAVIIDTD